MHILLVSSSGGHWEQLLTLSAGFDNFELSYVCSDPTQSTRVSGAFHPIMDCNQNQPIRLLRCLMQSFKIVRKVKPDAIVSTGAAPGLMVIVAGRLMGIKTVWIDSVANVEKLSLSGKLARFIAGQTYTQWPHLAQDNKIVFRGSVL